MGSLMRRFCATLVAAGLLLGGEASGQQPSEPGPATIVAPPQSDAFTMDSVSFLAGSCPEAWPQRVWSAFVAAGLRPREEGCQSVVADLDGNGTVDAVVDVATATGNAYVVVLDGSSPRVMQVSARGRFDSLWRVIAGRHSLDGCFDTPGGGRFVFSYTGFAISHEEKYMSYHHFENGQLIEEEGSGC